MKKAEALRRIAECMEKQATKLDLSDCYITDLNDLPQLWECTHLEELDLEDNYIKDISCLEKLPNLTAINLNDNYVRDFEVLKKHENLTSLDLSDNQISDYSFLENLPNLTSLDLSFNQISDYSFLAKLENLTSLNISSNQISDISFLAKFKHLTSLNLSFNQISDISFLAKLEKLTNLDINSNQISDINFLAKLENLRELKLWNNQISDISFLAKLENLTRLDLSSNQISDYSFLAKLENLIELNLWNNQISDISFLAKLENSTSLNLSSNQITDISFLAKLKNLTNLDISDNQISDISFLAKLKNLTNLDISDNQISDISFLVKLENLISLSLSSNPISDISCLAKLENLISLSLSSNPISDISCLAKLENLKRLFLSSNPISDISFLSNLENLENLRLSSNDILNVSFLSNLESLTSLYLSSTQISDISFLSNLKNLTYLELCHNQITDISILEKLPYLRTLHLSDNQITDISIIRKLPYLKRLSLYNNPIKNIDKAVFGDRDYYNCLTDLRNYWEDIERGKTINNEIKILLVGNGGVGKTQIAKRLAEQKKYVFNTQHDSTHAICLLEHSFACRTLPVPRLKLQLWDFAGQELYHATHRLFMQTKALFFLVWDLESEGSEYHICVHKKYENEKMDYWLEYIHHFGQKSPVLVLQNKTENEIAKEYGDPAVLKMAYQDSYNIKDFLQVSAKTGNGFWALEKAIVEVFEKDGALRNDLLSELPSSWVKIRAKCRKALKKSKKSMSLVAFEKWCEKAKVKKSMTSILNFLHHSGVVFYRANYFNNQIILNQEWAIRAIYKILDRESTYYSEILRTKKGVINYDNLCDIWPENDDNEREIFIDFMLSCEFCFELENEEDKHKDLSERTFAVPQLLSPKKAYIKDLATQFCLTETETKPYRFLPSVYIQRFIVRANKFARVQDMWPSGILLRYEAEKSYAIVESDKKGKTITIRYTKNATALRKAIFEELAEIEGEGKGEKIAAHTPHFDDNELDFAKKYIKTGFAALQQNKNTSKQTRRIMNHKDYIESLLQKGEFKQAVEELLKGTKHNGQASLHGDLSVQSGRLYGNDADFYKGIKDDRTYDTEKLKLGGALRYLLGKYKPAADFSFVISNDDSDFSLPKPKSQNVNTRILRKLLQAAFDENALQDFCFDFFPDVEANFAASQSKARKIRDLIRYCQQHNQIAELLANIKEERPEKYKEFIG